MRKGASTEGHFFREEMTTKTLGQGRGQTNGEPAHGRRLSAISKRHPPLDTPGEPSIHVRMCMVHTTMPVDLPTYRLIYLTYISTHVHTPMIPYMLTRIYTVAAEHYHIVCSPLLFSPYWLVFGACCFCCWFCAARMSCSHSRAVCPLTCFFGRAINRWPLRFECDKSLNSDVLECINLRARHADLAVSDGPPRR